MAGRSSRCSVLTITLAVSEKFAGLARDEKRESQSRAMSDVVAERRQQVFPKLNDAQLQRIARYGEQRRVPAGEILFDQGTSALGIHVVLSGALEIVRPGIRGKSSSPSSTPESSPAK